MEFIAGKVKLFLGAVAKKKIARSCLNSNNLTDRLPRKHFPQADVTYHPVFIRDVKF